MRKLIIVCDSPINSEDIRATLASAFEIELFTYNDIHDNDPDHFIIVDMDLKSTTRLLVLKEWLKRRPKDGKVLVVTDKASHLETIRAHAIGATDTVHRPMDGKRIRSIFGRDFESLAGCPPEIEKSKDVVATLGALQEIFSSAYLGDSLNPTTINAACQPVIRHIETQGLVSWIDTVRKHHSVTYQHSLLVTGIAVSFGLYLGCSNVDRERLSFAGMLHDIGKARIPLAILEKPGPLDEEEITIMQKHPQYGLDALKSTPSIDPKMTDMVLHHHEYLDGSGYPHRLQKNEISDFVRMITISDIFAALMEQRSYRPPMLSRAAYQILLDMGPKLDKDLVREFSFVSNLRLKAA
jgi:putative nucleotidyltransferase with HDIG domain